MNFAEFEASFNKKSKNWQVCAVLKDRQWHCRECEYRHARITQIAGGGGIQGLQRGTKTRPGMVIDSANHLCTKCERTTRQDRWTGAFQQELHASSMPAAFVRHTIGLLRSRDVVENTERTPGQLTIDHKLPMIRWNPDTKRQQTVYTGMSDEDIVKHFQLLKKSNGSVSHNLLKSRACEKCYKTGNRGMPFGISFFYAGGQKWAGSDKTDATGCIGCGWFDFDLWRDRLNKTVRERKGTQ